MVRLPLGAVAAAPVVQLAVRAVAVHGATDAWEHSPRRWAAWYAAAAVPWPATTPLFFAASCLHFARDVGVCGSAALHLLWAAVWRGAGLEAATVTALAYMVHLPLHYRRAAAAVPLRRWAAPMVALTLLSLLSMLAFSFRVQALEDWVQRIVCVHAALGASDGVRKK